MASINGLDADLLNVAVLNANENIFIRGATGTQGQVISYDANRRIEFSDVVNDNDNIAVIAPIFKTVAGGPPPVHTLSLGYNTNDFQLDGSNRLELKDTIVDTAVLPLSIASDTITLGYNTNDFQLNGSNLLELKDNYIDTAVLPLYIDPIGTIDLDINNTLEVVGGELGVADIHGQHNLYKDSATNLYYKLLMPSDFMNGIKLFGGFEQSPLVINNTANGAEGALQCYDGLSYYSYFQIPNGYTFTGFRVNITDSAGTATTPASSSTFYCKIKSKTIGSAAVDVGADKAYNTDNVGFNTMSGWDDTWVIGDVATIPKMMMIECYRSPNWSSSLYNGGGWIQFTKGVVSNPITLFTLNNDYIDGLGAITMFINAKPTLGKSISDGGSISFSPSDFDYQLNVAYPITSSAGTGTWSFMSLVNCSVSSSSWDGDNSNPVSITFLSASSSMLFDVYN